MQTDRELDAIKAVAGVMIAKSTAIPTPRQLKKDPDVDYSEVMRVLGGYEKAIKKAQAYLDEQGYELVSYDGVRKKKKRTKITDSLQGNQSSRQSVDKTPIKPTYTDEELMDHLVRLYEEGDLSYEDICIYGMTAEEVIMRFEPNGILDRFRKIIEEEYRCRLDTAKPEVIETINTAIVDTVVEIVAKEGSNVNEEMRQENNEITEETLSPTETIAEESTEEEVVTLTLEDEALAPKLSQQDESKDRKAKPPRWTDEKCIEAVHNFCKKYGEYPRRCHFNRSTEYGLPSICTIRQRFGGIPALLQCAAVESNGPRPAKKTKSEPIAKPVVQSDGETNDGPMIGASTTSVIPVENITVRGEYKVVDEDTFFSIVESIRSISGEDLARLQSIATHFDFETKICAELSGMKAYFSAEMKKE